MFEKIEMRTMGGRWLCSVALALGALACSTDDITTAGADPNGDAGRDAAGDVVNESNAGAEGRADGGESGTGMGEVAVGEGGGQNDVGAGEGSAGDISGVSGALELVPIRGYSTPVFLMAIAADGKAVGLLATKDDAGNPVRIKGVALLEGEETFRIEFDADGKPTLMASPDDALLFSDYRAGNLHVTHVRRGGTTSERDVDLSDEDLAKVTVVPPTLGFVQKEVDGTFLGALSDFSDKAIRVSRCTLITLFRKYPDSVWNVAEDAYDCAAPQSLAQRVFTLMTDSAQCTVGLGASAVIGISVFAAPPASPLALAAIGGLAVKGILSCQDVAEDVRDLKAKPSPQRSWFEQQLQSDTTPVPSDLKLSVHALPMIRLGEQVNVTAVVEGGKAPYQSAWIINGSAGPVNTISISDSPKTTTLYEYGIEDSSTGWPRFAEGAVVVNVCGDHVCSSAEDGNVCPEDCGAGDGGKGDGGISDHPQVDASLGGEAGTSGLPAPPGIVGSALGDPHLRTFDGTRYDCQPAGEETLAVASTGDLEVQTRTRPFGKRNVAVNVAVAARVATDRVAFYLDGSATLNHAPTIFDVVTHLPGGGAVWRVSGGYAVVWPDNSQLRIAVNGDFLGVQVYISPSRSGHVTGLLGSFDGVSANDLTTRDGTVTLSATPTFRDFYGTYVESWRVAQADSLFDYGDAESTATFTDRTFPGSLATVADLRAQDAVSATTICQAAGVLTDWMDACVMDVGFSGGDARFAQQLALAQTINAKVDVQPPFSGPPAVNSILPQIVVAGGNITIIGSNLSAVSGDASAVTVTLVAAAEGGTATIALPVVASSPSRLTVSTPANLAQVVSGSATIRVTTPLGTAPGSSISVVASNGFGGNGGTDGLFGAVYPLVANTSKLPSFGDVYSLTDVCRDPSVINGPDAGVACPLTTLTVPNLNVPNQSYTTGFPGFPMLTTWFAVRFRGVLRIDTPGDYRFETFSDDGSNAYLFDLPTGSDVADSGPPVLRQVVSNDGLHGFGGSLGAATTLAAGRYGIVVDYYQGPGSNLGIELLWAPPGQSATIIPASNLQALVP